MGACTHVRSIFAASQANCCLLVCPFFIAIAEDLGSHAYITCTLLHETASVFMQKPCDEYVAAACMF